MEKPVPETEAELTVTAVEPVEVSVTEPVAAEFTATLPKLRVEALTANFGLAAAPVPLRDTVAVPPLVELLLMVSLPVSDAAEVGLN